ncbi:hypothetical protein C0J52_08637 [Blattella germanica]|nr:hypothetical protein C0J52_08637 [Blattella germanica]
MKEYLKTQDENIKRLTQEKEQLLAELKALQDRADRKSVDVKELKADIKKILSDHKRFQECISGIGEGGPSSEPQQEPPIDSSDQAMTEPEPEETPAAEEVGKKIITNNIILNKYKIL